MFIQIMNVTISSCYLHVHSLIIRFLWFCIHPRPLYHKNNFYGFVFFALRSWGDRKKIRFHYFLCQDIWLFNISYQSDRWCLAVNVFILKNNINNKYTSDTLAQVTLSREFRVYLHNFRYRDTSLDLF